jgi:lysophospholipase L1-like esterase
LYIIARNFLEKEFLMAGGVELKAKQTIVFTGDSITDTGRSLPAYAPFGYGYVNFVANTLLARYARLNLNIVNTGVSGNTVRNLKPRWKRDCLDYSPDVISLLIGVNDLWRQHVEPDRLPEAVYPSEYESVYRTLLAAARRKCAGVQLVLMEPFLFCGDKDSEMRRGLDVYLEVVHRLSEEFGAVLVRLQEKIDAEIKTIEPRRWSDDSVHPHPWAHAWIALRWLEAAGL